MRNTVLLVLGLISLASCGKKEGNLHINGTIENADVEWVYLQDFGTSNATLVDSASIGGDGSFELITNIGDNYSFYRLILDNNRYSNLVLRSNDNIQYSGDANNLSTDYTVSGSDQSEYMKNIIGLQYHQYFVQDSLKKEMKVYNQNRDMGGYVQTLQLSQIKKQEYTQSLKDFINDTPASLASLVAAEQLDPATEFEVLDKVLKGLKEIAPNTQYYEKFDKKLEQFRKLAIGAVAPELAFNDPDGNLLKLSDFRGKYVLIDFWASWCKPCRAENPNVIRLYDQYKDKGFEIVGVSLDQKKDPWVKAIAADGITWPQMSDLGGWQSAPARIYNISSIPATILLDQEGVIIDKNLRGNMLADKLSQVFADYSE